MSRFLRDPNYEPMVRVDVYHKAVFGDCLPGGSYQDDSLVAVRDFLNALLAEKIPPEYHATAKFAIDSVGGYEGEHHAELSIYYERPETPEEKAERLKQIAAEHAAHEAEERRAFASLKKKYG